VEEREELLLVRAAWDRFLGVRSAAGDPRLLAIEDTGLTAEQFYQFYLDRCQYSDLELKPTQGPRPDLVPAVAQVCELVREVAAQIPEPLPEGEPDRFMATVRELRHFVDFAGPPSDADRERLLRDLASKTKTAITLKRWGPAGSPARTLARRLRDDVLPALRDGVLKPLLGQWRNYVYTLAGELVDEAMVSYRDSRLAAATLTFNDLLESTASLLRDQPDVRAHFQRRYRRLFVDEFQDTDPLQAEILLYLTGVETDVDDWRQLTPRPGSLFLVGDEKQSIYRFRRADVDIFRLTRDQLLAGGGDIVELTTSFRSQPQVISWVNNAFEPLFENHDGRYQAQFQRLIAHRKGCEGASVYQLRARADSGGRRQAQARDEAGRIATFIAAALQGRTELNGERAVLGRRADPGDFMILTRSRRHLDQYASALQTLQVPYDITGAGSMRHSVELRAIVDALDSLLQADDPVPLVAYLRGPLVGLGDDELYVLRQARWDFCWTTPPPAERLDGQLAAHLNRALGALQRLWDDVRQRPLAAALERFIESTGLAAHAAVGTGGSSRAGNLLRVLAIVRDAQSRRGASWGQLTDELRDLLEDDRQRVEEMTLETGRPDVVRVMNLHQAKGLEAKVVFLADAADTSAQNHAVDMHVSRVADVPYLSMAVTRQTRFSTIVLAEPEGWSQDAEEEARFLAAENLRLVYVAATRARDVLVLGTTGQRRGAWAALEPVAQTVPDLPIPAPADPHSGAQAQAQAPATGIDVEALQQQTRSRWAQARRPTHVLESVTGKHEIAPPYGQEAGAHGGGAHGGGYGTVVHRLLEHVVKGRLAELDDKATAVYVRYLLASQSLPDMDTTSATEAALGALHAFRKSEIWKELGEAAGVVHTEVPFAEGKGKRVRRGVIDLVYRVDGGWKIVDYKTYIELTPELTKRFTRQVTEYAEHWETISGEAVVERGLWLAASSGGDRYLALH
jgi:ATP-dependent helicase/nuclease subunit A